MKDNLLFLYLFVLPVVMAFLIDGVWSYIKSCVKRVKSRENAKKRLAEMKRREEYELATYRFRDPHYYGD